MGSRHGSLGGDKAGGRGDHERWAGEGRIGVGRSGLERDAVEWGGCGEAWDGEVRELHVRDKEDQV